MFVHCAAVGLYNYLCYRDTKCYMVVQINFLAEKTVVGVHVTWNAARWEIIVMAWDTWHARST